MSQKVFGIEIILYISSVQLHYIDTDGKILSMKTEHFNKVLKNLKGIFDFSNLDENQELYSSKNENVFGKIKNECPKNIWIDKFFV